MRAITPNFFISAFRSFLTDSAGIYRPQLDPRESWIYCKENGITRFRARQNAQEKLTQRKTD
jgi:hypothetical protein